MPVRLRPDFPQRPKLQRAYLLAKGLNTSDVRVFSAVLDRTVNSKDRVAVAALSLSDLAERTAVSRRTVIRSMERLREAGLLASERGNGHYHDGSLVGLNPNLLEPLVGDTKRSGVTNQGLFLDRIYNLDALHGMRRLQDCSVDLILSDLPYGEMTHNHWDSVLNLGDLWKEFNRVIKPDCAIVLTAASPFSHMLAGSNLDNLKHEWIWVKERSTNFLNAKLGPLRNHETVLVFCDGVPFYRPQFGTGTAYKQVRKTRNPTNYGKHEGFQTVNDGSRYPKSVLHFPTERNNIHPTQKPVDLFEFLIRSYAPENGLVLDCCIGSGTTGVAALKSGRHFIGFELDKSFFKLAQERLKSL